MPRHRRDSLCDVGHSEAGRRADSMINRWAAALISACTIIGSTGVWVENASAASPPPVPAASRVMVMPFETTAREPRSYWLGEGSAVILSDSLLALGLPVMRRDERLHSFELQHVPVVAGLSQATIIRVAQVVGASQVIVGGFSLNGGTLNVRARAILLDTGLAGPEVSESGPLEDIFHIYDRVALRLVPGSTAAGVQLENSHPPIAAFEQFIKGPLAGTPAPKRRRPSCRSWPKRFDWRRNSSPRASPPGRYTMTWATMSKPWPK